AVVGVEGDQPRALLGAQHRGCVGVAPLPQRGLDLLPVEAREPLADPRSPGPGRYSVTPAFCQSSRNRLSPMPARGRVICTWKTGSGSVAASAPATAASTTWSGLRSEAARMRVSKS